MDTEKVFSKRGVLPPGYDQVLEWKITRQPVRTLILLQVVSLVLFIAAWVFFTRISFWVAGFSGTILFSSLTHVLAVLGGLVAMLVLHELTHGAAMRIFGAKPQYGAMWRMLMFYATSPGFAFPRNQYLMIALAPLIVLSVLAILGMIILSGTEWVALLALVAAMNAAGAIGDLWMTGIVLRYPASAYIIDEIDGIRVFLSEQTSPELSQS